LREKSTVDKHPLNEAGELRESFCRLVSIRGRIAAYSDSPA
jgi:hypothetical protein